MIHEIVVYENILEKCRLFYFLFLDYFECITMPYLYEIIICGMNLSLQFFKVLFIVEFIGLKWIIIWHKWTQILIILLNIFFINHQIIPDSFAYINLLLVIFIWREIVYIKIINWTVHFIRKTNVIEFLDLFVTSLQVSSFFNFWFIKFKFVFILNYHETLIASYCEFIFIFLNNFFAFKVR